MDKLDDYLYLGVKGLSKFHHSNRKIFLMKTYKIKRKVEVIKSNYQTKLNCLIFVLLFFCRKFTSKTKLDALCVLEPFTKPSFPCQHSDLSKEGIREQLQSTFLVCKGEDGHLLRGSMGASLIHFLSTQLTVLIWIWEWKMRKFQMVT